jgi:hypothetical protein
MRQILGWLLHCQIISHDWVHGIIAITNINVNTLVSTSSKSGIIAYMYMNVGSVNL